MNVKKSELARLFVALGVETADGWTAAKLEQKANAPNGLARYLAPDATLPDGPERTLFGEIEAARIAGHPVVVEDDGDRGVPAKPAPAAKPKSTPAAKAKAPAAPKVKPKVKLTWKEKLAKWKAQPAVMSGRPGVFATVLAELQAAGKGKTPRPVTKDHIVGVLRQKFPDRDPDKMATSVSNLVPSRLGYKWGIHVWSDKTESGHKGYYVIGDGKTPQPAAAQAPAPAPAKKKPAAPAPAKKKPAAPAPAKKKPAAKAK